MSLGCTGLLAEHKSGACNSVLVWYVLLVLQKYGNMMKDKGQPRTNPHARCAERECRSQALAIEQATSSNNLHVLSSEGALVATAQLRHRWDQKCRGHIAGVATALTTLRADDVDAELEALLDVLGVSYHVHVEDAICVQLVHDFLGRDTDGRDKQFGAGVDDDVDELAELALGVVVAVLRQLN